jgi:hypothetical protein
MSLRRFARFSGLAALPIPLVACAFLACSGLKRADDPVDAAVEGGEEDSSVVDEGGTMQDGAVADGAMIDAGTPPLDFECTTDAWTKVTKGKKECAPRQVKDIEAVATIDTQGISIARTPAGRVGIAYNSELDGDTGEMHFAYFTPTTPTYAAPKLITKSTGLGFHDGYLMKLAASAPDTLALLTYDQADYTDGEVHFRKLVAGTEPLTDALVATGVKYPTVIGLGSDLAGNTIATYRVSTAATTAKLSAKKGTPAGLFTALPDVAPTVRPQDAPGIGAASIFFDSGGQAHLLYHHNDNAIAPQGSWPRYHTLAGSVWSSPKTINNNAPAGLSGYSSSIVVFGTKKYAVLFSFKSGQSTNPKTADLLLVSWDAALDMPATEILDTQIPADGSLNPAYRAVLGVDKYGLLHVAMIIPTDIDLNGNSKNGYLEYRRQTRLPDGTAKWLTDIVDPDVISEFSSAFVDMVVDENARPHIAYRSAKDGKVKYATRFDRP